MVEFFNMTNTTENLLKAARKFHAAARWEDARQDAIAELLVAAHEFATTAAPQPTDTFSPMNATDRAAFQGAGDGALICYTTWGAVIVERVRVQAIDNDGQVWQRSFSDVYIARGYAECCVDIKNPYGLDSFLDR